MYLADQCPSKCTLRPHFLRAANCRYCRLQLIVPPADKVFDPGHRQTLLARAQAKAFGEYPYNVVSFIAPRPLIRDIARDVMIMRQVVWHNLRTSGQDDMAPRPPAGDRPRPRQQRARLARHHSKKAATEYCRSEGTRGSDDPGRRSMRRLNGLHMLGQAPDGGQDPVQ